MRGTLSVSLVLPKRSQPFDNARLGHAWTLTCSEDEGLDINASDGSASIGMWTRLPSESSPWYFPRVTIPFALRLPTHLVEELDLLIASGQAPSRTAVVTAALRHELRQYRYDRERDILLSEDDDTDLTSLHEWVSSNRPSID